MWLKYNRGSMISTPGNNNAQSLKGLAAKHTKWKFLRNVRVVGLLQQLRNRTRWRWPNLMLKLNMPPPMDLSSEKPIPSPKPMVFLGMCYILSTTSPMHCTLR